MIIFCVIRLREARQLYRWLRHPLTHPQRMSKYWLEVARPTHQSLGESRARQLELLETMRTIRDSAEKLPDACIIVDRSGVIENVNRISAELLGVLRDDVGKHFSDIVRHVQLNQAIADRETDVLLELESPRDSERQLEIRLVPLDDDRQLLVARDITRLNRLLSMRQDFIANVSHELRTPLTILSGYVEELTDGHEMSWDIAQMLLQKLQTPTARMKSLIEDLLTLTQLEAAPLPSMDEVTITNGATLARTAIDDAQHLACESHVLTFHGDEELTSECVPSEMQSVFTNLVVNAVRYSPKGGNIVVRWYALDDLARFEVQDQGIGIAQEHLSRITERFYRVFTKIEGVTPGTGLGLAIVKHVLLRHKSKLQVKSKLGEGSLFYFDLPRSMGLAEGV